MSKKESASVIDDLSDIHVSLKPLFGIPPRLYLKVFFLLFALLLFFILLLYPGILNYGSVVQIESFPPRASVYLNGSRVGSTPLSLFIPAGEHHLELHKPFFADHQQVLVSRGRRFFTLFSPRRIAIQEQLSLINLEALLEHSYREASFSYAARLSSQFPREPFLRHALEDILLSGTDPNQESILRWAADLWAILSDQDSLDDISFVWRSLYQLGLPLNPTITTGIQFDIENPSLEEITIYQAARQKQNSIIPTSIAIVPLDPITILGMQFRHLSPAPFIMGDPRATGEEHLRHFSSQVNLANFYFMEIPVSQAIFNTILISGVSPDDNSEINFNRFQSGIGQNPVTYISLPAVRLFLQQLNQEIVRLNLPLRARLPLEAEWEYLAQNSLITLASYEWMEESYFPLKNLLFAGRPTVTTKHHAFLHSVRGVSILQDRLAPLRLYQRGAQNPDRQSPFITFRVILERA